MVILHFVDFSAEFTNLIEIFKYFLYCDTLGLMASFILLIIRYNHKIIENYEIYPKLMYQNVELNKIAHIMKLNENSNDEIQIHFFFNGEI